MPLIPADLDLCDRLGVTPAAGVEELDRAYVTARNGAGDDESRRACRVAWKVLRDPFYGPAYEQVRSLDLLIDAGFFDDGLEPEDLHGERIDHRWLTTPVHKLGRTGERPVVLLTTGGFSPVHDAHREMMELARATLEAAGRSVLGGYLSPSHDSYVSTKDAGRAARPAEQRLLLCEEAVRDSDWLMVDPWEARATGIAVNYTDVLLRLEAYLALHVRTDGEPIEVVYVFGGDNAGFARAFIGRGTCVCVPRPGFEADVHAVADEPGVAGNARIHFARRPTRTVDGVSPGATRSASISSSAIRAGGAAHVARGVAALLAGWDDPPDSPLAFAVRDDLTWATAAWRAVVDADALDAALDRWRTDVLDALTRSFAATSIRIECYNIEAQAGHALALQAMRPVLGLDPCTTASWPLAPARLFALSDGQRQALATVARPGHPPLAEQLRPVPPGAYTLVDDDVATGATVEAIRRALPAGVCISEVVSLLDWSRAEAGAGDALHDFVDLRDFLVGARDAGLVVELPTGAIGRAPYLLPYVSPASRMSMPPGAAVAFSAQVWDANARLFAAVPATRHVRDVDPASRGLWSIAGFTDDVPLADVCRWHATRLRELPYQPAVD